MTADWQDQFITNRHRCSLDRFSGPVGLADRQRYDLKGYTFNAIGRRAKSMVSGNADSTKNFLGRRTELVPSCCFLRRNDGTTIIDLGIPRNPRADVEVPKLWQTTSADLATYFATVAFVRSQEN